MQRVLADSAIFFALVERAIRNLFLPVLMDLPADGINGDLYTLLSKGVKQAGMCARNPVETVLCLHEASKSTYSYLTSLMVAQDYLSIGDHYRNVTKAYVEERKARLLQENALLEDLG